RTCRTGRVEWRIVGVSARRSQLMSRRHAGVVREPYRPHECRRASTLAEIEIGIFKSGRQAYGFDDIAIVPSRRTRDPEDVDIRWEIDAYQFELPVVGDP